MVIVFGFPQGDVLIRKSTDGFKAAWEDFKMNNHVNSRSQIRFAGPGTVIDSSNEFYYILRKSPFGNIVEVIDRTKISDQDEQLIKEKRMIIGGIFDLLMEKVIPHSSHNPSFAEALRYSFATDRWDQNSSFFMDKRIEFNLQKIGIPGINSNFAGLRFIGNYLYSIYSKLKMIIIGIDESDEIIQKRSVSVITTDKLKLLIVIDKTPMFVIDVCAGQTRIEKIEVHEFSEYKGKTIVVLKEYGE